MDLTQAVAPDREGVRHATEAPLTGVEGALPGVHRARVAIGHDHFADRGAVEDRADAPAVLVADPPQDQALVRIHPDAERPLLPADEVAFDGEARPLRLGDVQRTQVGPHRPVVLGVIAARRRRDRRHPVVRHLEHLAPTHVHEGEQPLERAGVPVVLLGLTEVGEAAGDPPSLLVRKTEGAGGPGIDLDQRTVDDTPPVQRRIPLRMFLQGMDDGDRLLNLERRPDPRHDLPSVDLPAGDGHDGLHHVGSRALEQDHPQLAVDRDAIPAVCRAHGLLGRFEQPDVGEADVPGRHGGPPGGQDHLACRCDLVAGQARQGVHGGAVGIPVDVMRPPDDGPLPFPSPLEAGGPHAGRPRPCHPQRT